jgi:hypothetical protein
MKRNWQNVMLIKIRGLYVMAYRLGLYIFLYRPIIKYKKLETLLVNLNEQIWRKKNIKIILEEYRVPTNKENA